MAAPSASLILKRLRQRFGINAPKLAIKTHLAWHWRALAIVVALSVSLGLAAWMYDAGRRIAGLQSDESVREIESLRSQVMALDVELTKLRSLVSSGESSLQIERATQKQLSQQVKTLEAENATLKEDVAFFEGLMPASGAGNEVGVRIDHLKVQSDGVTGEYRYRMLVVNNAGRQSREFKGELQLLVKVFQAGKDAMILYPSRTESNPQRFRIEIKNFHRLEGVFTVPSGALVKSVEARLMQDGTIRARQTVIL